MKAVFTGSFDPYTIGHDNIIQKALPLFSEIHILVCNNNSKTHLFTEAQRIERIQNFYNSEPRIQVKSWSGLVSKYCEINDISFIIRGARNEVDFSYESLMAEANKKLNPGLETLIFLSDPELRFISSTLVRDLYKNGLPINEYTEPRRK
jgi:pantetheine-phosphate adenylyltransferase